MLSEVKSLISSLTDGIAKRQESSGSLEKDSELAVSMLAEVKSLLSSLTSGIAKRKATTTTNDALDISPASIDAYIDSLHKLVSTLKGGVAKRQDTTDITSLVERLEELLEPLKAASSAL
jgi:chemotaxis regulatin CheY-phosphate phosphatase CheZ